MSDVYKGRDVPGLVDPNPRLPLFNLIAGLALILIAVIAILANFAVVEGVVGLLIRLGDDQALSAWLNTYIGPRSQDQARFTFFMVTLAVFGFFYLRLVIAAVRVGLSRLGRAIVQWTARSGHENVPDHFADVAEVAGRMLRRERYGDAALEKQGRLLFGPNARFISPVAAPAARAAVGLVTSLIGRLATIAVFAALFVGCVYWLAALRGEAGRAIAVFEALLGDENLVYLVTWTIIPFVIAAVLTAVGAALDFVFVRALVPRHGAPADHFLRQEAFQAGLAPSFMADELAGRMQQLRFQDFYNRQYQVSAEGGSVSVGDTGEFVNWQFFERQPLPIANPNQGAGTLRLATGWGLSILGLGIVMLCTLPEPLRLALLSQRLPDAPLFLALTTQLALGVAGIRAWRRGQAMVAQGERILSSFWFRSVAASVRMKGTVAKREISAKNKAMDTIGTKETGFTSHFQCEVCTAELISEVPSLTPTDAKAQGEPRILIGLGVGEDAGAWQRFVFAEMQKISQTKVGIAPVDTNDPTLRDMVVFNAQAQAFKEAQVEKARQEARAALKAPQGDETVFLPGGPRPPQPPGGGGEQG